MAGLNSGFSPSGATKATCIESSEFQESVLAKRTCEIPNDLQCNYAYNGSNLVEYIGYAARSLPESANGTTVINDVNGWIIHKFTYSGTLVTQRRTAFGSWTNRATLTYA